MKNHWHQLWSSFLSVQGWYLGLAALAMFLIPILLPTTLKVELDIKQIACAAVLVVINYLIVLILINAFIETRKLVRDEHRKIEKNELALLAMKTEMHPRLLRCIDMYANSADQGGLWFVMESSKIYSARAIVVFHHLSRLTDISQNLEKRIGYGFVENIQGDGTVVIRVTTQLAQFKDVWSALQRDEQGTKELTQVRPTVYIDDLQELHNERR